MQSKSTTTALKPSLRFLSHIMRKLPRNIRKTSWWWAKLYDRIGGGGFAAEPKIDNQWPAGLQDPITTPYGYSLHLDLQNWMERRAYFSGVYYQADIIELLTKITQRGDQFIDIGANIGFITVHAAHLVGPKGKVIACEPNPNMLYRLRDHIELNHFNDRVAIVESALGETESSAILHVPENHPGMGTLTGEEGIAIEVPVIKGDDAFSTIDSGSPVIIKIDVEGFEQKALSGSTKLLEHPNIMIIIEITDNMLKRVGDSAAGLYDFLKAQGFEGFLFKSEQERFHKTLNITPCNEPLNIEQYDAIFVKSGSSISKRLT